MRWISIAILVVLSASAMANVAMGFSLVKYDFTAWLVYVASTICFEALAFVKIGGFRISKAFGISILANFATAFCCTNLFLPFLHQTFFGTSTDPNPLAELVVAFTVFGLASGALESLLWLSFAKSAQNPSFKETAVKSSLLIHIAWVPVGMAIMLVPSQPYRVMELTAEMDRRMRINILFRDAIGKRTGSYTTLQEALNDLARYSKEEINPNRLRAMGYVPSYDRFSTTDTRRYPYEWNPKANNIELVREEGQADLWLARSRIRDSVHGYILTGYSIHTTTDPDRLGY